MDSLDLLAREDEFKKLNKQLEKKTESLMKEIEQAMQKQDIFSEFSPNLTLSPVHTIKKHSCESHNKPNTESPLPPPKPTQKKKKPQTTPEHQSGKIENGTLSPDVGSIVNNEEVVPKSLNTCNCCANLNVGRIRNDDEFLYAFVSVNVKEKVLPQSFLKERPTIESVCKFLSSKVKLMQDQIDRLQGTLDQKATQCDAHLRQLAEYESERLSLQCKMNSMASATADMKGKNLVLLAKLNEKERLYKEQRAETDKLTCELKRHRFKCASAEAKSASQQETIDNLRQQLETARRSEKEFRESSRNLSTSHQNAISRLEAHIKVLNTRSDRQMALIDNLRKQNALLATEGALKALEREYCDYLNQDL
uniref:SFRICE_001644 n=1 Tax=Spodoptera frugiperda TaxID=7108 RepID=A0A2H1VV81_SPOFR